jgi:hypothetical protein
MGAKNAMVPVGFIDYNKRQRGERFAPFRVPREDLMKFMRVGYYDARMLTDGGPF